MNDMKFTIYNNRRSCDLTYTVKKTSRGWHISHIAINGECEPDGTPYFYENFDQDNISYPSGFSAALAWLWEMIDNEELPFDDSQNKLQELADWVSHCEKSQPKWRGWNC